MIAFPNPIEGRPVEAGYRQPDINPSNVNDVVGEAAWSSAADVDAAIAAARKAFPAWSQTNPQRRFDILDRGRHGNPGQEGRAGPPALARERQAARRRHRRSRRAGFVLQVSSRARRCASRARSSTPCGPASTSKSRASRLASSVSITPWNFPLAIPAWKIAPALRVSATASSSSPPSWRRPRPWTLVDIFAARRASRRAC